MEVPQKTKNGYHMIQSCVGFPGGAVVKNLAANARDTRDIGLIPGSGRSPGEGNGNPLQYSCLENPTDRGAWWATVCRAARSWTRLSEHTHIRFVGIELFISSVQSLSRVRFFATP